jgi:hypothetical protein
MNLVLVALVDKVTLVAAETTLVNTAVVVAVKALLAHATVAAVALGLTEQLMQVVAVLAVTVLLGAAVVQVVAELVVALILAYR